MLSNDTPTHADYIILIYIIAISGFCSFFSYITSIFFISPYIIYLYRKRHLKLPRTAYVTLAFCALWITLQSIAHKGLISPIITQTYRFYILALLAILLKGSFVRIFPKIIYTISVISLVLWICCFIPPFKQILLSIAGSLPELRPKEFIDITSADVKSLYIYVIPVGNKIRNFGPFWEPGMYAVFLMLALSINVFKSIPLFSKENIILMAANVTTFSTTGYVAMLFILTSYIFLKNKNIFLKVFSLFAMPSFMFWIMSLDFMKDKILKEADNINLAYSRFGALFYHWEKIKLSPIIGYGVNDWPRTAMDSIFANTNAVSPNGLTLMGVVWGIPLGILYFILIYKSIRTIYDFNKIHQIIIFITILLTVFSQDVTNRPFFYMLAFMTIVNISKEKHKRIR